MKSHERFVANNSENNHENSDGNVHESNREINRENGERNANRAVKRFVKFGEKALPEYTRKIWTNAYETMEPRKLDGLVDILVAIKAQAYDDAATMIKQDWISDGLMMGTVATLLPEGVEVVRQVYTDTWGEAGLKKNIEFLDKTRDWHIEQHKAVRDRADKALKANYANGNFKTHHKIEQADSEAYHGPTTREKFMERVHDMFGPEEARMLAYRVKEYFGDDGGHFNSYHLANCVYELLNKKHQKPKDPVVDEDSEHYLIAAPLYRRVKEPLYVLYRDDWTKQTYKNDLKKIRKVLMSNNEGGYFSDRLREIDDLLADPNASPRDGSWNGTTMKMQDIEFTHCRDVRSAILGEAETELRLYMCPRSDNMMELIEEFKYRSNKNHLPYVFKFANNTYRSDRFIVYTNYEQVNEQLDILKSIKKDRPELFEDMDDSRKNPFWGKIDGAPEGVYFGEQPRTYPRDFELTNKDVGMDEEGEDPDGAFAFIGYSYGGLRGEVFDRAFDKWVEEVCGEEKQYSEYGRREYKNVVHFDSPSDISWENAERLEEIFREELDKADIDPDNMCFDKYPDTPEGPYKRSYYDNHSGS